MPELTPEIVDTAVFLAPLLAPAAIVVSGSLVFGAIIDALISAVQVIRDGFI